MLDDVGFVGVHCFAWLTLEGQFGGSTASPPRPHRAGSAARGGLAGDRKGFVRPKDLVLARSKQNEMLGFNTCMAR